MPSPNINDVLSGADRAQSVLAGTAAAAGANGADVPAGSSVGVLLVVDITAITGTTPTLTVTLQGKDPVSGKYYTILVSAALNAIGTTVLRVHPSLTPAVNLVANDVLPAVYRAISAIGGTTPAVTYTVSAHRLGY